jgi:hypothetical protein
MEIQNISGTGSVPAGFSVNTDIPTGEANNQREEDRRSERIPEPEKGQRVDSYA